MYSSNVRLSLCNSAKCSSLVEDCIVVLPMERRLETIMEKSSCYDGDPTTILTIN